MHYAYTCVVFQDLSKNIYYNVDLQGYAFDASVTAAVRGDINVYEHKQKYCGELLDRSIQILCVEMPRRLQFLESQRKPRGN